MKQNKTIEEYICDFETKLTDDVTVAFVSGTFFDILKEAGKIKIDPQLNEVVGRYIGNNHKVIVICDFIKIGKDVSERFKLSDLGEGSYILIKK